MQVTGYNWYTFGITHQHASAEDRQLFALSSEELTQYYEHIFPENECAGFITNTCNRTSFFLFGKHPEHIEQHFLQSRNQSDILEIGERHIGRKALNHLFEVIAGLDSQILGDFEIVGQIKAAFDASKNHGATLGIVEKLVNQAIHSSRRIKNETNLIRLPLDRTKSNPVNRNSAKPSIVHGVSMANSKDSSSRCGIG